jgi:hypothetical protein
MAFVGTARWDGGHEAQKMFTLPPRSCGLARLNHNGGSRRPSGVGGRGGGEGVPRGKQLPKVIQGVKFTNGAEVTNAPAQTAA